MLTVFRFVVFGVRGPIPTGQSSLPEPSKNSAQKILHGLFRKRARGEFTMSDAPGLGLELDEDAIAAHPYQPHAFPSLWDERWLKDFTPR